MFKKSSVVLALLLAFTASLFGTGVAFAEGTIPDPEPWVTTGPLGTQYGSGGCAIVWVPTGVSVDVKFAEIEESPVPPSGWEYTCKSTSLSVPSGVLIGSKHVGMCWSVPVGSGPVQVYRLNQYGGWEPWPTVQVNSGLVCSGSTLTGTFGLFVPAEG